MLVSCRRFDCVLVFKGLQDGLYRFNDDLFNLFSQLFQDLTASITLGFIYLLQSKAETCFKLWLGCFERVFASGHRLLLEALYDVLFPRGAHTLTKYINFGSGSQESVHQIFTNFYAYAAVGRLYRYWWATADNGMKTIDDTKQISESSEATCSESGSAQPTSVKEFSSKSLTELENHSLVASSSMQLLSSSHALYQHYSSLLARVESLLMEMDIKARLKQHILEQQRNKKSDTATTDETAESSGEVKEEHSSIQSESMSNKTIDSSVTSKDKSMTIDYFQKAKDLRSDIDVILSWNPTERELQDLRTGLKECIKIVPTEVMVSPCSIFKHHQGRGV